MNRVMMVLTLLLLLWGMVAGATEQQTPALQAIDLFDSFPERDHADRVLLMGPGAHQTVHFQLCNPESVIFVSFVGTFPAEIMTIESITLLPHAWDDAHGGADLTNASYNNETGTFEAFTAVLDSHMGLTLDGTRDFFAVDIAPRDVLALENPTCCDSLSFNTVSSKISKADFSIVEEWDANDLTIKLAYVGDIAGGTDDVTGEVPYLEPQPDGNVDYHDLVAFVDGWNGDGTYQDKIADIDVLSGGLAPGLIPNRDGLWTEADIEALLSNWRWFDSISGTDERVMKALFDDSMPILERSITSNTTIDVESNLDLPVPGKEFQLTVRVFEADRLMTSSIMMIYDPEELRLQSVEPGEMLASEAEIVSHTYQRDGLVEHSIGRISPEAPGVSGDGIITTLTFEVILPPHSGLDIAFDLRDENRIPLAQGSFNLGVYGSSSVDALVLSRNFPNPVSSATNIVFALPERSPVDLGIFDLAGRRVVTLLEGAQAPGVYPIEWDGTDRFGRSLPNGVYFYRLQTDGRTRSRSLIISK